jgi:hypothetical protein
MHDSVKPIPFLTLNIDRKVLNIEYIFWEMKPVEDIINNPRVQLITVCILTVELICLALYLISFN